MTMSRTLFLVVLACLALIGAGAFAFRSFVSGDAIRWSDAYVALESAEVGLPANPSERERLLLANAMAEDEPPPGMTVGPRVHAPGTLLRLRYEVLGEAGEVTDTIEVRTIVPRLPAFGADAPGAPFGDARCPQVCGQQLEVQGNTQIRRTGQPGLAEEWVLRMPAGASYDLGRRSFTVQDFQEDKALSIPQSRLRVTLLEACKGRLRAGETTSLEFFPFAPVPIPSGFRTSRWIQLNGCLDMVSRPPPPRVVVPPAEATTASGPVHLGPEGPAELRSSVTYPADALEAIKVEHGTEIREARLVVDERWLAAHGRSMRLRVLRACRYDSVSDHWIAFSHETQELELAYAAAGARTDGAATRVAMRLPEGPALFWVEWIEAALDPLDTGRRHAVLIQAGRVTHCRYGGLAPAAEDQLAVCVPNSGGAEARVVPDPGRQCPADAEPEHLAPSRSQ